MELSVFFLSDRDNPTPSLTESQPPLDSRHLFLHHLDLDTSLPGPTLSPHSTPHSHLGVSTSIH